MSWILPWGKTARHAVVLEDGTAVDEDGVGYPPGQYRVLDAPARRINTWRFGAAVLIAWLLAQLLYTGGN